MGFSNSEQLRELFLSGGMGFLLGAYYDVFRILRQLLRPRAWQVCFQDLLFCITAAGAVFLFALAVTDGVLRVYLHIGLLAGFFAYRYTVGFAVVRITATLLGFFSRLVRAVRKKLQKKMKKFKKGIESQL